MSWLARRGGRQAPLTRRSGAATANVALALLTFWLLAEAAGGGLGRACAVHQRVRAGVRRRGRCCCAAGGVTTARDCCQTGRAACRLRFPARPVRPGVAAPGERASWLDRRVRVHLRRRRRGCQGGRLGPGHQRRAETLLPPVGYQPTVIDAYLSGVMPLAALAAAAAYAKCLTGSPAAGRGDRQPGRARAGDGNRADPVGAQPYLRRGGRCVPAARHRWPVDRPRLRHSHRLREHPELPRLPGAAVRLPAVLAPAALAVLVFGLLPWESIALAWSAVALVGVIGYSARRCCGQPGRWTSRRSPRSPSCRAARCRCSRCCGSAASRWRSTGNGPELS